jgi:hypothetical protein
MLIHFSARLLPLSDVMAVCERLVGVAAVHQLLEHIGSVYTWGDTHYALVARRSFAERIDSCEAVTPALVDALKPLFDAADFIDLAS